MKHSFVIIIIIIVALAVLYVYGQQIGWQTSYEQVNPTGQGIIPDNDGGQPEGDKQPTGNEAKKELAPSDVVYVANNFATLAQDFDPYAPFTISRIWLEDGTRFYVEYKNQRKELAQILVVKESGAFKGVGYFAPGESGWDLQAGEGDPMKPHALLYEKDGSDWIRKN